MRLFVDVLPLSAIIASFGAREVYRYVHSKTRESIHFISTKRLETFLLFIIVVSSILVSFSTSNQVVRMVPRSFNARESMEKQVGQWLAKNFTFQAGEFYCSNPAVIYYWGVNYFDVLPISALAASTPKNGSIIIWDSVYGVCQGMPYFLFRPKYRLVTTLESQEYLEDRFEPVHPHKMTFVVNVFQYDERLVDDVEILESYVFFNNTSPRISDDVLVSTMIRNVENSSNGEFSVGFWVDEVVEKNLIGFETIPLNGSPNLWVGTIWKPTSSGTHRIFIVVDFDNRVSEYNEYNNFVVIEITILE